MSDFDKEAEREKLREKFERDKEKRKNTQRMSELLLKGATMTNQHCDTCGDPIFRYDGQEFCPTCQQTAVEGGPQQVEASEPAEAGGEQPSPENVGVESVQQDGAESPPVEPVESETAHSDGPEVTPVENGQAGDAAQPTAPGQHTPPGQAETEAHTSQQAGEQSQQAGNQPQQGGQSHQGTQQRQAQRQATTPAAQSAAGQSGDLSEARASLRRTVTRFAREAEAAEDPRRAKELLSAAREAAETLDVVER